MPQPPPTEILTARLRLRPAALEDADAIFDAWTQDPEVTLPGVGAARRHCRDARASRALPGSVGVARRARLGAGESRIRIARRLGADPRDARCYGIVRPDPAA
jgi:hypothetical protein